MRKQQKLEGLISNYYIRTALIPISVIGIVLLLLHFTVNMYISQNVMRALQEEVRQNSKSILAKESEYINSRLNEVARLAILLQNEHEHFFSNMDAVGLSAKTPLFAVAKNGVFYKTNKEGSSLYYSSKTIIRETQRKKALYSETMDGSFKSIVDHNPDIVAAYFNSWDDMNRLYPFIDKVYEQYGDHIHMEDYNFYYLADQTHNPQKKPVWTGAYLDPAGNDWMISCIVPVYNQDFLEGVTGIDVSIHNFVENILNRRLPWNATLFMVDEEGTILAMSEQVEKLLGLEELKKHVYTEAIKETVEKPAEYNLLKNVQSPYAAKFRELLKSELKFFELSIGGKEYLMMQETVSGAGWKVIVLIEKDTVFQTVNELKYLTSMIGYVAIAFMLFFYLTFFYYLAISSKKIARQISTPIKELSQKTASIGTEKMNNQLSESHIEEIDQLNRNFIKMVDELRARTKTLIAAKLESKSREEEVRIYHEKALTDPLTGLYNRSKADEALNNELERYKRYGQPFSVIMLDIDLFKEINDNHGHIAGDTVLTDFAELLKNNARITDVVTRIGGDEFLVISSNNELEGAVKLAEKMRKLVEKSRFLLADSITISLGVTTCQDGDSKTDMINRADKALYQAKEKGRNRVVAL